MRDRQREHRQQRLQLDTRHRCVRPAIDGDRDRTEQGHDRIALMEDDRITSRPPRRHLRNRSWSDISGSSALFENVHHGHDQVAVAGAVQ